MKDNKNRITANIAAKSALESNTFHTPANIGLKISIYSILIMVVCVTANTIGRTVSFLPSFTFVEEYSGYFLVATVFLGLGYTLRTDGHVKMTLLTDKLPKRVNALWEIMISIIAIIIITILLWHASKFALASFVSGEQAQTVSLTPMWIPKLVLVPGYLILIIELCLNLIKEFKKFKRGKLLELPPNP